MFNRSNRKGLVCIRFKGSLLGEPSLNRSTSASKSFLDGLVAGLVEADPGAAGVGDEEDVAVAGIAAEEEDDDVEEDTALRTAASAFLAS